MKTVRSTARSTLLIALPAVIGAYFWAETKGVIDVLLGLGLALFSVFSFGLLTGMLTAPGGARRPAALLTTSVWMLKLPLIWLVVSVAVQFGNRPLGCFLAGLGLVYSALVFHALVGSKTGR